jgi:hypothetical protein
MQIFFPHHSRSAECLTVQFDSVTVYVELGQIPPSPQMQIPSPGKNNWGLPCVHLGLNSLLEFLKSSRKHLAHIYPFIRKETDHQRGEWRRTVTQDEVVGVCHPVSRWLHSQPETHWLSFVKSFCKAPSPALPPPPFPRGPCRADCPNTNPESFQVTGPTLH